MPPAVPARRGSVSRHGPQSGSRASPAAGGRGGPLPAGAAALFSLSRQRGRPSGVGAIRTVPAGGSVAGVGPSPAPAELRTPRGCSAHGPTRVGARASPQPRQRWHTRGAWPAPLWPRRRLPMVPLRPCRPAGREAGASRPVFRTIKCFSFLSPREVGGALPGCSRCRGRLGRERRGERLKGRDGARDLPCICTASEGARPQTLSPGAASGAAGLVSRRAGGKLRRGYF